ncbi:hypothetical protein DITRI_Ditri05aG0164300 [Diplodiscus trichospermus]
MKKKKKKKKKKIKGDAWKSLGNKRKEIEEEAATDVDEEDPDSCVLTCYTAAALSLTFNLVFLTLNFAGRFWLWTLGQEQEQLFFQQAQLVKMCHYQSWEDHDSPSTEDDEGSTRNGRNTVVTGWHSW